MGHCDLRPESLSRGYAMSKSWNPILIVVAVLGVVLCLSLFPVARSQIQVAPAYVPIGAAASGATSMAWFHQPSSNTVVVCQAASGAAGSVSGIQCVSARLP